VRTRRARCVYLPAPACSIVGVALLPAIDDGSGRDVEEAHEVRERAEDVPECVALVERDVAEQQIVQAGQVGVAAARVQLQRLHHLHHGLEEVGPGRVRGHRDLPHRLHAAVVMQVWFGAGRRGGRGSGGGGGGSGGRRGERGGGRAPQRADVGRVGGCRRVLDGVDDGVGEAGRREEEAAGGDCGGQPTSVRLGLGVVGVERVVVVEEGRGRRGRRGRRRRGRAHRRRRRRRGALLVRQGRPPAGDREATQHCALRGPRHRSL